MTVDLSSFWANIGIPATWRVFFWCLITTGLGVALYLFIFPLPKEFEFARTVALGIIVAIVMMGLNYAAKFSNTASRDVFTPVDFLSYSAQGFAWPALWPSLAQAVGAVVIDPAEPSPSPGALLQLLMTVL